MLKNIRLGWKGLNATSQLAYYATVLIIRVKSFIAQATGMNVTKLFFFIPNDLYR